MHNRKLLLVLLSAAILAFEGISLGWSAYTEGQNMLAEHLFRTTFALYIGVLVVRSVGQCTIHRHSESVIHITALTFFSSVLHVVVAILPSFDSISARNIQVLPPLLAFWYAVTALYISTFTIIATTPRGPPLHYSPSFIYSQKTIDDTTNKAYENVCGAASVSVIDYLWFRFVTRVVQLGSSDSVEIGDLPILPATMRATYQFCKMRTNLRANPLKPGWDLAWRLISINKLAFSVEVILAVSAAPMWFASPFFVRKLIAYLEGDPDRLDRGWGWVYALGQFASLIFVTQRKLFYGNIIYLDVNQCAISQQSNVVLRNNYYSDSLAYTAQHHTLREDSSTEGCGVLFWCPSVRGENR
jgi:hypothetical protein